MQLDLTDDETVALTRLLTNTIDADRYPLSPRIQILKGVLAKLRPGSPCASLSGTEGVCAAASRSSAKTPAADNPQHIKSPFAHGRSFRSLPWHVRLEYKSGRKTENHAS
jgi:hypothetical protein